MVGHGLSGLMKSGVTDDMPPRSLAPASRKRPTLDTRLGGTWMLISGINDRAVTTVESSSASLGPAQFAIGVLGFGAKGWTMISWMWP